MEVLRKYLTTIEIAQATGLSASFYEKARWRRQGPPYLKVGSRVLYYWEDVAAWLESRRQTTQETA